MYEDRTQNYEPEIHEEYLIGLHDTPSCPGLSLSFLCWTYVRQGVYFWAYGVSIFGVFVRQA